VLFLAFASGGHAQKRPATEQKKIFPPVPVQQRQFCAAYREDAARHHQYEAKAAAAPNPIARLNVEKTEPEFEKLFYAKQAEVMAGGSFQDWTGRVHIAVKDFYSQQDARKNRGQIVIVVIEFPCIWTDYEYGTGRRTRYSDGGRLPEESLQFGNGFDSWPQFGDPGVDYIPVDSTFGQSLSAVAQDEPVAVSGNLICTADKGCLTTGNYGRGQLLANITSVRSLKTGKLFKLTLPNPLILSEEVPFESISMSFYWLFNQEAQEMLERYAKGFDSSIRARTLSVGTRYIPLMKTQSDPVIIKGPAGATYVLIAILDAVGKPREYAMIPNVKGLPAKLERPILEHRINPKDGLTYVLLPPGRFTMGCSPSYPVPRWGGAGCSNSEKDETPVHEVTITKGIWIGESEVTQEAYQRVIGKNPSHFKGAKLPVEQITWNEAQNYCQAIGMRLPTEAEWEYAARAGTNYNWPGYLDDIAWHLHNSDGQTHFVKQKQANDWGLYDMVGNVYEWVSDWYGPYPADNQRDPSGPVDGRFRIARGGSWGTAGVVGTLPRAQVEPEAKTNCVGCSNLGVRCAGNSFEEPRSASPAVALPAPKAEPKNSTQAGPESTTADNVVTSTSGLRRAPSENKQQRVKVCRKEQLLSGPPIGAAARGSGRLLGTTDPGDEPLVLERGDRVSKVQFDLPGQQVIGWLANSAFCTSENSGRIDTASTSVSGPAAKSVSVPSPAMEHTLKLTPDSPLEERTATIVAPGNGVQNFNIYYIDTEDFADGGVLDIEIQISPDSATDGSFNLFPPDVPIPSTGRPIGALVGRYDVRRGTTTHLQYRFRSGQVFAFGLEGNWFSPRGSRGTVHFRASVRK